MPNWPIGYALRNHLSLRIREIAQRPVALAKLNFPLTVNQIQESGLGLTAEQLATLEKLYKSGVTTIDRTNEIRLAFLREVFPELRRGIVLKLTLPEPVFTGRATLHGMSTPRFSIHDSHYLVPHCGNLDSEALASLFKWMERLLRQYRINEVVHHCVQNIVAKEKRTPTIAHLNAIWPGLGAVLDPANARFRTEQNTYREWIERFRNPPRRNLQLYTPDTEFMALWAKRIKLADVQLAQGLMLSMPRLPNGAIVPEIEHWQRLDGDITF